MAKKSGKTTLSFDGVIIMIETITKMLMFMTLSSS
jgi:hypothetical protein